MELTGGLCELTKGCGMLKISTKSNNAWRSLAFLFHVLSCLSVCTQETGLSERGPSATRCTSYRLDAFRIFSLISSPFIGWRQKNVYLFPIITDQWSSH
jgi:hypothetical protein